MQQAQRQRSTAEALGGRAPASSHSSRLVWCGGAARPSRSPRAARASRPWRSATTLCWWIVSRFSWRAEHEARAVELGEARDDAGDHLAHAVLDEARAAVGLLDDLDLVRALHQLVDLRGHARLGDRQQRGGVDLGVALLDAADVQRRRGRAGCAWRRARARGSARSARRRSPSSASRSRARAATSSCAHGQAVMPVRRDADDAARAVLEGDRAPVAACRSPASATPDTGAGLCSG